jgi:hypothetical protein
VFRTTRAGWTPMPDEARTDPVGWHAPTDRQVPNWQVRASGVMSLLGANWWVQGGLAPIEWDA